MKCGSCLAHTFGFVFSGSKKCETKVSACPLGRRERGLLREGNQAGGCGESQAGKSVPDMHRHTNGVPSHCAQLQEQSRADNGERVQSHPRGYSHNPSDGPSPGSSQKASSLGQDQKIQAKVKVWL